MNGIEIFFALCIGHALADYPLQGDFLARAKNRLLVVVPGERIWPWALIAHAAIHAGAVWAITGSSLLALAELLVHAAIDAWKCEGGLSFNADQTAHVGCKVVWALLS